jgi:hypothetical protein
MISTPFPSGSPTLKPLPPSFGLGITLIGPGEQTVTPARFRRSFSASR